MFSRRLLSTQVVVILLLGVGACQWTAELREGASAESSHSSAVSIGGNAIVTINTSQTFQTIDGFGGAQPGGDPDQLPVLQDSSTRLFTFPRRDEVMDLLFSPEEGIGMTVLRMKINAMLERSPGVFNDKDDAQQWIIQQAAARGPVKTIASSWSPPAWMKTNGATNGGALAPLHYQDFADVLAYFAGHWATQNQVDIYAISMANEPDTLAGGDVNWDTCEWSGVQYATFLRDYLGPTLARNHISTKVIAPEMAHWDLVEPFMAAIYADPIAFARVDIVAGHLYMDANKVDSTPSLPFQTALNAQRKLWQSEFVTGDTWTIDQPLEQAKRIHDGLTGAQISAWVWYVMFGGTSIDQNTGSLIGCVAGVDKDHCDVNNTIALSRMYWVLGNFSKFIRPGYVRVGSTTNKASSSLLDASAYKDPATGKLVVVVINRNLTDSLVTFDVPGLTGLVTPYVTSATQSLQQGSPVDFQGTIRVPARSVVTYVSNAQPANPPRVGPLTDIVLRNANGMVSLWQTSGGTVVAQLPQAIVPGSDWQIYGTGDFDGDGSSDILWRNTNGTVSLWLMSDGKIRSVPTLPFVPGGEWQIQGTGDFNGDGSSDILWRNVNGTVALWLMRVGGGGTILAQPDLPVLLGSEWQIQGTGDFNHDHRSDIVWRNSQGTVMVWLMGNAGMILAQQQLSIAPGDDWQIQGTGDFNGDGTSDILWRNTDGTVSLWLMLQGAIWSVPTLPFVLGEDWQIQGAGDFNGDGASDILWRNTNGTVGFWLMTVGGGGTVSARLVVPVVPSSFWQINGLLYTAM
jgi:glucuronoarabinoxylan endo-1,4-beta-xylanase